LKLVKEIKVYLIHVIEWLKRYRGQDVRAFKKKRTGRDVRALKKKRTGRPSTVQNPETEKSVTWWHENIRRP
jgi:hypothetical protein